MQYGDFYYPIPVNEPVLNYAPGSTEKKRLKEVLKELKSKKVDAPMYIGSEEVRTGKKVAMRPPQRWWASALLKPPPVGTRSARPKLHF